MKAYLEMEMPTSCAKCKLFGEYGCPFIGAVGRALTEGRRNEDCPFVPVPEHGRLIDADKFYEDVTESAIMTDDFKEAFAMWLETQETVIPAEEGE